MKQHLQALALLLALAGVAWYFLAPQPHEAPQVFYGEGNIVKDNPGLTPGVWYLVYEEPGFPGLSIALSFDDASRCELDGKTTLCDMPFLQGDRVRVDGGRVGEGILVKKLVFATPEERGMPIRLYYYNEKRDVDALGNIMCSTRGLQYVDRVLPSTKTPLADAIKLLVRGEITEAEKAIGISSQFPLIRVRLENAAIVDGMATLTFSDPDHKTSGGACRANILRAQVEATAKQFSSVKEVSLLPNDVFQP